MRFSLPHWSLFGLPPATSTLLGGIVGIHLLFSLLIFLSPFWGGILYSIFMLDPQTVLQQGHVWRVLTYALVHDLSGPMHIVFNTISLAVLGPALEDIWGSKGFLRFIFATALGGGIAVCVAYALGLSSAPVVGASASALGLLVAFGVTFPDRQLLLWGILAISGRQLIGFAIAIEMVYMLFPTGISTAAHVGGMIMAAGILCKPWRHWRSLLRSLFKRNDS
ncbi:MAG: rhomboid family intramembrane serine protease [Myxococcota bacterium]